MNSAEHQYYYPNIMGRMILLAVADELGMEDLNAILETTGLNEMVGNLPPANHERQFSFEQFSQTMAGIEQRYGARPGHGVALRVGRASFKYGLREFGPALGVSEMSFRLLPLPVKLKTGTELMADAFNRYSDQRVRVEDHPEKLLWHIERCPVCWGRHTDEPVCHLAVGVLQEALYWLSGGKFFHVEETQCIAQGDSVCTIEIVKKPLG